MNVQAFQLSHLLVHERRVPAPQAGASTPTVQWFWRCVPSPRALVGAGVLIQSARLASVRALVRQLSTWLVSTAASSQHMHRSSSQPDALETFYITARHTCSRV
jgi:hypothetical protein